MTDGEGARVLGTRMIETLYTEAMLLADEARAYFDQAGVADRAALTPSIQVGIACESLKLTTRLMQIIAWLLTQRAVAAGELTMADGDAPQRRLGEAADSDPDIVREMPAAAAALIAQSLDLFSRVARLDAGRGAADPSPSPARTLLQRLQRAF